MPNLVIYSKRKKLNNGDYEITRYKIANISKENFINLYHGIHEFLHRNNLTRHDVLLLANVNELKEEHLFNIIHNNLERRHEKGDPTETKIVNNPTICWYTRLELAKHFINKIGNPKRVIFYKRTHIEEKLHEYGNENSNP